MISEPIDRYLAGLENKRKTGRASEHTYRPVLENYLTTFGVEVLNDPNAPKPEDPYPPNDTKRNRPDFIVERNDIPVGHIECKDIGENLDAAGRGEQLLRYRDALHNLVLTNYLEFRWYVRGERQDGARLGWLNRQGRLAKDPNGVERVLGLLDAFLNSTEQPIDNPADLARRMAGKARLLRRSILDVLADNSDARFQHYINGYRKTLIENLTEEEFADMQAQTAVYGLFAARCLHRGPGDTFNRKEASFAETTPFLKAVLNTVAGHDAHPDIKWIVNDIAALLARADMDTLMSGFGQKTAKEDPIVHFYEDFLDAYDPQMRKNMGVYYTPRPIVSYIVNSIDMLLRNEFGLQGMADISTLPDGKEPRVLILDPAIGTGTFLREVISTVRRSIEPNNPGGWPSYWKEHLLPRLFGFELLMAPYAICHLALALELMGNDIGFELPSSHRINVYLTNTLKPQHAEDTLFDPVIAAESRHADEVKQKRPVMVVLGNPPYKGDSKTTSKNDHDREYEWITRLLKGEVEESPANYFAVDGVPLSKTEKNLKWLHNSYIRFIRFAHWRIEQTGEGILGFITDNSYLDSITARGVRQSLMSIFDSIWILDLHGNSNKKEKAPDGTPDSNVFGIKEGVAIGLFVKHAGSDPDVPAKVFHAERWGKLETPTGDGKYDWLALNHVNSHPWSELAPKSPHYLFVPQQTDYYNEYHAGWNLTDIFRKQSVGITTGKDPIAVRLTKNEMERTVREFGELSVEELLSRYHYPKITRQKVVEAQHDVLQNQSPGRVIPILYQPFDTRHTYYTGRTGGMSTRPRRGIMQHMLEGENLALATSRGQEIAGEWCHVLVSRLPMDLHAASKKEANHIFPLYEYAKPLKDTPLLDPQYNPNLKRGFINAILNTTGLRYLPDREGDPPEIFGPEDIFGYIYAVLHSPEYRRRYADFLKHDFPHIPTPPNSGIFTELATIGKRLVRLHLLDDSEPVGDKPRFCGDGDNRIGNVAYRLPEADTPGRVWINDSQYFEGVSPGTWTATIGGYQPVERWLKDRTGRTLEYLDIILYERICGSLSATRRVMEQIDTTIATHGGWVLDHSVN